MKIKNPTSTYHQKQDSLRPSFGYLPICRGNIIKTAENGTKELLPVDICLLRAEDRPFMQTILEKWTEQTSLGYTILTNFLNGKKLPPFIIQKCNYFMLIPAKTPAPPKSFFSKIRALFAPKTEAPHPHPLCLAEIENGSQGFELNFIQASPETMKANHRNKNNPSCDHMIVTGLFGGYRKIIQEETKPPTISGTGQMLLYGICRFIKSMQYSKLKINSQNDAFYEKLFHGKCGKDKYFRINSEGLTNFIQETRQKYKLPDEPIPLPQKIVDEINNNTFE